MRLAREAGRPIKHGAADVVVHDESLRNCICMAEADSAPRQRFLREARVAAQLQHPHIVPLHAVGEQDGMPYFVMARIDGVGLDRLLADPESDIPRSPLERARWVAGLGHRS